MSTATARATAKSYGEPLRELVFHRMIELDLEDLDTGRVISDDELRNENATWGK